MLRVSSVALLRVLSLGVVAASAAGLFVAGPLGVTAVNADIVATDSAVTVKWQGGTSELEQSQPARNPDRPHFADFKGLTVTVSQTTALTDQAIKIDFSGLDATKTAEDGASNTVQSAQNFMQFMQCWGDPASDNFRNTCEWGGYGVSPPAGLSGSVPRESYLRSAQDPGDRDVTFLSAQGKVFPGIPSYDPERAQYVWPLGEMFDASSSNEIIAGRVGTAGFGTTNFEVQSANRAPQLGCGSDSSHVRCYLVAVPRGSHFGGESGTGLCATDAKSDNVTPYTYGRADSVQEGSPLNPACDYWDNRIVIPLDFTQLGNNCPTGSAELRTIGSQLMVGAMSSWQPAVCQSAQSVFNFSTNPDSVARSQLITGRAGMAFTSYGPEDDTLSAVDKTKLAATTTAYAPVAVSAVTVAFFYEDVTGRRSTLNLTPRLMAKLLTESYQFQNPLAAVQDTVLSLPYLDGTTTRYRYFTDDPEFRAINPEMTTAINPAVIIPGPAGADAVKQVWKWILSDKKAASWVAGAPDEQGMRINPYYLPLGDSAARVPAVDPVTGAPVLDDSGEIEYRPVGLSNVDGTPFKLSETVRDTFAKADQTEAPATLPTGQKLRFTSVQSAPYADSFLSTARAAFRADANSKIIWDGTKINLSGEKGDYVSAGPQLPAQKFAIAITDTASAEKFGLSEAALCNANMICAPAQPASDSTPEVPSTFVPVTTDTMEAALEGLSATSNPQIVQVDPAAVPMNAYPLTTVTYAAVNLTLTDEKARAAYGALVQYAVTDGQRPGTGVGNLPLGYVPLNRELTARSLVAVQTIIGYVAPVPVSTSIAAPTAPSASVPVASAPLQAAAAAAPAASPQTTVTTVPTASAAMTAAVDTPVQLQGALGVSLIVGLAGAAFAPVLMRPRRQNG